MHTEIPHLEKIREGVLVNTDSSSYSDYMKRKSAFSKNDAEVSGLKNEINNINARLDTMTVMLRALLEKGN